jgi:hypothetical protein
MQSVACRTSCSLFYLTHSVSLLFPRHRISLCRVDCYFLMSSSLTVSCPPLWLNLSLVQWCHQLPNWWTLIVVTFPFVPECSRCRGEWCSRRFSRTLLHGADLTWLLSLPTWDRCGRASLPPALAYDLQSTDEGTGLPVRRRLVPSCNSGQWRFTRGYTIPGLGYLLRCWLPGYLCRKVLHRAYCFYQVLCTLRWNHYCVYACIHVRATLMGWIPALECIVSGVHGLL